MGSKLVRALCWMQGERKKGQRLGLAVSYPTKAALLFSVYMQDSTVLSRRWR